MELRSRRNMLLLAGLAPVSVLLSTMRAWADDLQDGSFKRDVLEIIARRRPNLTVVPGDDPAAFSIGSATIYLDNLYQRVRGMMHAEREEAILSFVEDSVKIGAGGPQRDIPYAEAQPLLRPQIVPDEYRKTAADLVLRPFMADLSIAYAIDNPKTVQMLLAPTLSAWHVRQSEVDERAIANLEAASATLDLKVDTASRGGYLAVSTKDGYDATRLILPGFMRRVRDALNAPLVFVGIPNRDFLIAWTPDLSVKQEFAVQIGRDVVNRPYPRTDALFASSSEGVRLLTPEELRDHGR